MSITASDVKLMQPERLTDEDDGGGSMTGNEVIDGDINNLFEDISRVNRAYGNVSMRKAFLKVDTDTTDIYLDAHAIITAQPSDPNVSGLLFTTDDFYDVRSEMQQRVESYVIIGAANGLRLRGNHYSGSQSIIVYATNSSVKTPASGDIFALQTGDDEATRQFVQVTDVTETTETFSYTVTSSGVTTVKYFSVTQWVLELSTSLERDFPNGDPHPYEEQETVVYNTNSSSIAKYYGTTELEEAASSGDTTLQVVSTYGQIIPTASAETSITDQKPGGWIDTFISSEQTITLTVDTTAGQIVLPTPILPGSISFTTSSGIKFVDANEQLERTDGSTTGFEDTEIDYANGTITITSETLGSSNQTLSYTPAAVKTLIPYTGTIQIGDNNRNYTYVLQLNALPARKTFSLDYQVLDKWYTVTDDGTGNLIGDGTGQINYDTGSVTVTLTDKPDASSTVLYKWTDDDSYTLNTTYADAGDIPNRLQLSYSNITPGTVTITWTQDGTTKTATDDGAAGITGDATGKIAYSSGYIDMENSATPDTGTDWSISYTYDPAASTITEEKNLAYKEKTDSAFTFTAASTPVSEGSVQFTLTVSTKQYVKSDGIITSESSTSRSVKIIDDGDGNLVKSSDQDTEVGTVDYSTGTITLNPDDLLNEKTYSIERWEQEVDGTLITQYETVAQITGATEYLPAQDIEFKYVYDDDTPTAGSDTITKTSYEWSLNVSNGEAVVPGSVILLANSDYWFDNGNGGIVWEWSTSTGAGTVIGSIDYDNGQISINDYAGRPTSISITPLAVLLGADFNIISKSYFRTANSPLKGSGFTIRCSDVDGNTYTAMDDGTGNISASGITGEIDLNDGLVTLQFSPPMDASTIYYNAVSYKSVPLSSEILGLDPVRLPSNGKVPILRDADIIVITHTSKDEIASPAADLVIDAGRTDLYSGWIEDENGTELAADQYTLDKEAGTATLSATFSAIDENGEALGSTLYFVHRIEDMALVSEARIDGQLTLVQPITHDYPAGSWVASAVYLGTLYARVANMRAYTTDVGYDEDESTPIETDASYNDISYPIAIDNNGAVPDRWMIKFTGTTAFSLYSEERGLVATGSTAADFSPINPDTGTPYFTIQSDGWGSGWSVGNCVYFDTYAAAAPLWMIRTVLPGEATEDSDQIQLELRGDHN
jgi:hypothetical protein